MHRKTKIIMYVVKPFAIKLKLFVRQVHNT